MANVSRFVFATCQVGAERALKSEVARSPLGLRAAFARPGFVTFKLPDGLALPDGFLLDAVFARSTGWSLGPAEGADAAQRAAAAWALAAGRDVRRVHVFARDRAAPGQHRFEPGPAAEVAAAHEAILGACPRRQRLAPDATDPLAHARPGELVLDCILIEPDHWWIGWHRAGSGPACWPGGMLDLRLPPGAVSRAWLKMEEALLWSALPIPPAARVAEIGSAPGGASQSLLARGWYVLGVDPAAMHPDVLAHPRFTHLRRRSTQARRRDFRKIRWLMVDMNVAPRYTLDAVEAVVTHPDVHVRGMLLTLKLIEWSLADRLPEYLARVRGWGFNIVRARQLQHNRREVCVMALKRPFRKSANRRRAAAPGRQPAPRQQTKPGR